MEAAPPRGQRAVPSHLGTTPPELLQLLSSGEQSHSRHLPGRFPANPLAVWRNGHHHCAHCRERKKTHYSSSVFVVDHRGPPPEAFSGEFSGELHFRNRGHGREALPSLFPYP